MDRFLRWARGLLGMSAIWGAGAALVATVVALALTVGGGVPVWETVVMAFGLFGGLGLVAGAVFGVVLTLATGREDHTRRLSPTAWMLGGFAIGGLAVLAANLLLFVTGSPEPLLDLLPILLRDTWPWMFSAGAVGAGIGGGAARAYNRPDVELLESRDEIDALPEPGEA